MKKAILALVIIAVLGVGGYFAYSFLTPKTIVSTIESYGIELSENDIKLLQNEYSMPGKIRDIAVKSLEPELCAEISETSNERFACFLSVAVGKSEVNICENLDGKDVLACSVEYYTEISVKTKNPNECEKLASLGAGDSIPSCYLKYAENANDESACEKAGQSKELCYKTVALSKPDPTLCEKAGTMKDDCYKNCQYRSACKAML